MAKKSFFKNQFQYSIKINVSSKCSLSRTYLVFDYTDLCDSDILIDEKKKLNIQDVREVTCRPRSKTDIVMQVSEFSDINIGTKSCYRVDISRTSLPI